MVFVSTARRLSRVSKSLLFLSSHRFLASHQCRYITTVSSHRLCNFNGREVSISPTTMCSMMSSASFSSEATTDEGSPSETVKELYDKMLQSVVSLRSMPPNAWLWSLIENCKSYEDIKLLFSILEKLRIFRLANLRIHENFNTHLCQEVTKACVRVGAIDFGKKALWKHNVYGLSPNIGSVHHLLLCANQHNDVKLMEEIMDLVKHNDLPLQSGTADIVFSICYNLGNWKLISKYSKRFVMAGVKLRPTTFDLWMEFAAKREPPMEIEQFSYRDCKRISIVLHAPRNVELQNDNVFLETGDVEQLWKAEELRSKSMKRHTIVSGISYAKGCLLEGKPQEAAAIIQALNEDLTDVKRLNMYSEIQKLVNEWASEVVKHQKVEGKKALATSLRSDIPAMLGLMNMELEVKVDRLEDLSSLC